MKKNSRYNNCLFYKKRKVLITGHTGFKGSWLTCIMNYFCSESYGYALLPESNGLFELIHGEQIINSIEGKLEDYEHLKSVINEIQPEIVIHLAAFGFINECFNDPRRTYSSNVIGTVNLLEAVRECESIKSVVIVSTDKVYANKGDGAVYSETDILGGSSPYSCSKSCMELIVKDYYDTYFEKSDRKIGIGVVRASNVLAGGDHIQSRLIPSILRSIDGGDPVELRNPNQTRPWQSVLDALDGYLTVARFLYQEPELYAGAWNIGPKKEGIKSVGWVFNKIESYFNGIEMKSATKFEVQESETLGLCIDKALAQLDWEPSLSVERVIELVVDFYKEQKKGTDVLKICQKQICDYYGGCNNEME